MKRSFPLLSLLLVVATLLAFVPMLRCPDCAGENLGKDAFVLGCPRCLNRGSVSGFNRWTKPNLHPGLSLLLRVPGDDQGPRNGPPSLRGLLREVGRENLLPADLHWAEAVGLDDGDERLPAAYTATHLRSAGGSWGGVFLFDPAGRLLDQVEIRASVRRVSLDMNSRIQPSRRVLRIDQFGPAPRGPLEIRHAGVLRAAPPDSWVVRLHNGKLDVRPEEQAATA